MSYSDKVAEIESLRTKLAQAEQQLHDLSTSHFELMEMDAEHHSRALEAEKQLAEAQATIEAKDTELGKQDAEIIVMKATLARLEASHAEALQWQDYLTQSRNTLEQQRDQLQRQVARLNGQIGEAVTPPDDLRGRCEEFVRASMSLSVSDDGEVDEGAIDDVMAFAKAERGEVWRECMELARKYKREQMKSI